MCLQVQRCCMAGVPSSVKKPPNAMTHVRPGLDGGERSKRKACPILLGAAPVASAVSHVQFADAVIDLLWLQLRSCCKYCEGTAAAIAAVAVDERGCPPAEKWMKIGLSKESKRHRKSA